jgi:hypothetical protein
MNHQPRLITETRTNNQDRPSMTTRRLTSSAIRRRIIRSDSGVEMLSEPRYTIASIINDHNHLETLHRSMRNGGFEDTDCEYMHIDNTAGPPICAYSCLNAMLNEARGRFVILCHQDIRLLTDARSELDMRLAELEAYDPSWALAGNAGGVAAGQLAIRVTDPHGANQSVGTFPARVMSLDENFIIVRREARIGFSVNLSGFHMYGADICLNAATTGWNAYVVNFHVAHLSAGKKDDAFAVCESAFRAKWSNAFAPRWLQTTCTLIHLAGNPLGQLAGCIAKTPFRKISRRLPNAAGWGGSGAAQATDKKTR